MTTVLVGRMNALPWRLLLRVSTNSTGPLTSSSSVASAGASLADRPRIRRRSGTRQTSRAQPKETADDSPLIAYRATRCIGSELGVVVKVKSSFTSGASASSSTLKFFAIIDIAILISASAR